MLKESIKLNVDSVIIEPNDQEVRFEDEGGNKTTVVYRRMSGLELLDFSANSGGLDRANLQPSVIRSLLKSKIVNVNGSESEKDLFIDKMSLSVLEELLNLIVGGNSLKNGNLKAG